jgi:hypothetical protein
MDFDFGLVALAHTGYSLTAIFYDGLAGGFLGLVSVGGLLDESGEVGL